MRGRRPLGPKSVERLLGSALAKKRMQVILETVAGHYGVREACARLQVSEPRFYQLREIGLQYGVSGLEPRPLGRPAHRPTPAEQELDDLRDQVEELQVNLQAAQIREEIALALPVVVQEGSPAVAEQEGSEKKTRRPRTRAPALRKGT